MTFLAEQIAGWPFDSEQDAIRAAEKFNQVAVSANLVFGIEPASLDQQLGS